MAEYQACFNDKPNEAIVVEKILEYKRLKVKVKILKRHYEELANALFSDNEIDRVKDMYYMAKAKLANQFNDIIPHVLNDVIITESALTSLQDIADKLFDPENETHLADFNKMNDFVADLLINATFGPGALQAYIKLRSELRPSAGIMAPPPTPARSFDDDIMT